MACITRAPTILASSEQRPPAMAGPPITTARTASGSVVSAMLLASEDLTIDLATSPATPAQKPQHAYTNRLIFFSPMPLEDQEPKYMPTHSSSIPMAVSRVTGQVMRNTTATI